MAGNFISDGILQNLPTNNHLEISQEHWSSLWWHAHFLAPYFEADIFDRNKCCAPPPYKVTLPWPSTRAVTSTSPQAKPAPTPTRRRTQHPAASSPAPPHNHATP